MEAMTTLKAGRMDSFLEELVDFCTNMDIVVVDTAPGISASVISCLMAADDVLLVTNPEPTAITDAYALLKVMSRRPGGTAKNVSVVMNQTDRQEEALKSYDRLRAAAKRFLQLDVAYLGSVAWDNTVTEATRRQVDFLTHYSGSSCSRDVRKIAARLVSGQLEGSKDMGRFFREMLEVDGE